MRVSSGKYDLMLPGNYLIQTALGHTWPPTVFIQTCVQDMSIIICACKMSVEWY